MRAIEKGWRCVGLGRMVLGVLLPGLKTVCEVVRADKFTVLVPRHRRRNNMG